MAGIALVKGAVDSIKSAIGTANDISEIAGYVDQLFEGEKQIQQKRSKKSNVGLKDQFGIKSIAKEVIDAKIAQEQMDEMRQLIDYRFGHGTWKSIVDMRAERMQEAKEAAEKLHKEKVIKRKEFIEVIKVSSFILAAVITVIIIFTIALYRG